MVYNFKDNPQKGMFSQKRLKQFHLKKSTGKNGWSVSTNMLIKFVMGDEDTDLYYSASQSPLH